MAFTYCENCGEKIDDGCKFCPNCGHGKMGTQNGGAQNMNDQQPRSGQYSYGEGQSPYGNQGGYGNTPPPYVNPNPYGNGYGQNPYGNGEPRRQANTGIVVFSVIVMVFFSMLFGAIAIVMSLNAPKAPTEEQMQAKNKTALVLCIIGVVVGIVSMVMSFALMVMAIENGYMG